MEYILFLTYRCNLNCEYCFAKNVVHDRRNVLSLTHNSIDKICKYIENDIVINNRTDNSIVFFGGEPSLVPGIISEIIDKTTHLNLNYSIYTNGLLLDRLPDQLLEKLHSILVAIDGDKSVHEKYKPIGSYDSIINNVRLIKPKTDAQIIARITMEEETNIYKSVEKLLFDFDYVHWQIVNKDSFNNSKKLVHNYEKNIFLLFNHWLDSLNNGIILNIIPFNRIVLSILTNEQLSSFRCGCGSSIQAIDVNGNIYSCDEYIENKNKIIGNIIDNKYDIVKYKSHLELFEDCKNCTVSQICLGRCRKLLESKKAEHIRTYCKLSKILINTILNSIEDIKRIISEQNINIEQFHTEIYDTEIIP